MEASTVAPAPGFWRRAWSVIQAVEMSSGEYQDLRIDALERRIVELEKAMRARVSAPSSASGARTQETP